MKHCLRILLGCIMLSPAISSAVVPTTDMPGTMTSGNEVAQTTASTQESLEQTTTMQKLKAKAGSAKASVSKLTSKVTDFKNKQLDKLKKHQEKLEKLKEKKEAIEAKKAKYEKKIQDGMAKAQEYKDKAQEYKEKAEDGIAKAKEYKEKAEGALETAQEYKDKATSTIDAAKEKAGMGAADSDSSETVTDDSAASTDKTISSSGASASVRDIVDTPVVTPTRSQIRGASSAASVAAAQGGAVTTQGEVGGTMPSGGVVSTNEEAPVVVEQTLGDSVDVTADAEKQIENTTESDALSDEVSVSKNLKKKINKLDKKALKVDAKIEKKEQKIKELEQKIQDLETSDDTKDNIKIKKDVVPTRRSFTSSAVFHTSETMAFAEASFEGGSTEDDILIIPEEIVFSDQCSGTNYKTAGSEGVFASCLKSLNSTVQSEISEDNTKMQISDAQQALQNGLAEYYAAAYFEALNIYNESVTFKNDQVDEVFNKPISSVEEAWVNTKEMQKVLGTRFNNLNRLWARELGIQTYGIYYMLGIK